MLVVVLCNETVYQTSPGIFQQDIHGSLAIQGSEITGLEQIKNRFSGIHFGYSVEVLKCDVGLSYYLIGDHNLCGRIFVVKLPESLGGLFEV